MGANRYPVLVWRDAAGIVTVCSVQHSVSAAAETRAGAIEQIKAYYDWMLKNRAWEVTADVTESTLAYVKVAVRPEYRDTEKRIYTAEPVTLNVPFVHGKLDGGMHFAAVPLLGIWFNYPPDEKLKDSVSHYVQQALREQSPESMLRFLAPEGIELDDVIVHAPAERRRVLSSPLVALTAVADPVGEPEFRSGISRPFGRERDLDKLVGLLTQERQSLLIVGGSGCGKTSVITEAARRVEIGPEEALNRIAGDASSSGPGEMHAELPRFWMTSGGRLIAGMKYLGQWEERVEKAIQELQEIHGVLCVESLLGLIRSAGRDPAQSIAAFLVPYLQKGELRVVVETTPEELEACRRLLPAIVDCCRVMRLERMDAEQVVFSLERTSVARGQRSQTVLEDSAKHLIYRLFSRFLPYQEFPGSAAAFVGTLFDSAIRDRRKSISTGDVVSAFVRRTGLPEWLLRDDKPLEHASVVKGFCGQIIGQDAACRAAADVVVTFKAGLNDPHRPLGTFLFTGPTGVGKTELAKTLGRYLFGHGERADPLIRLDMSEYAMPGAGERLLTNSQGEPSELVTRVRQHPFCVVLLDEIEKAAPEVFDVLLGVLDEGRLTDSYGRLTSFRSAVIILTSNLGAETGEPFGLGRGKGSQHADVERFFRPEFVNRLDRVVAFAPLGAESMRAIVIKELGELERREGISKRRVRLAFAEEVVEWICTIGFDRRYGARPLQRAIEQQVVTPLARYLLERKVTGGKIEVYREGGRLGFR